MKRFTRAAVVLLFLAGVAEAQVMNVKVVTDASPDASDMDSLVHSITSKWKTPAEKCWAVWYWNHIARRQTSPMNLHGMEVTDPIRQYNDYGYTMCSTVAGVNCGIWHHMGMKVKFWDITAHTVSECFYDERWHIYDDSMSAIYTLCDGKTIAGVEDVGKEAACAASGGRKEPGHIARYHCLTATSPRGFLTGADTQRDLDQEYRCFNPNALKFRWYYNNWDWGHRYILNLREDESYARWYHSRGDEPKYWVPNGGKDPESANPRYRIRGNGLWKWTPKLTAASYKKAIVSEENIAAAAPQGLGPAAAGKAAEVVFKVNSANVTAAQTLRARFLRKADADAAALSVSTTNGLTWKEVWKAEKTGEVAADVNLVEEVSGAYEVLVKVSMTAAQAPADVLLQSLEIDTGTMLNSKTQPKLLLGKNTVYVGTGDQTDSIVFWPDLQGDNYKPYVVEQKNMTANAQHIGYQGVMHAMNANEDAYVVFRMDAPRDITRVTYGGRLYNRAPKSHIDFLHSFDGGQNWTKTYSLTDLNPPWDVIHYETVEDVPAGTRTVLFKYLLNSSATGPSACSIFAVRMEADHKPVDPGFKPIEVTFTWDEVREDRTVVERSHTQLVSQVPFRYAIDVGGADLPAVTSLRVNLKGAVADVKYGYSDGTDVGGEKFTPRWVTRGRSFLEGKSYTTTREPTGAWGGDDPEGKKLTDGIIGALWAGGISYMSGACYDKPVDITVDIGAAETVGAFRIGTTGYPWWDTLKGEVKDEMEVLTSLDGENYTSQGLFDTNVRLKDVPINHMLTDDESAGGWIYELIPEKPVKARWVKFKVNPKRTVCIYEVQALDFIKYEPFDIRIALPDEKE